MLKFDPLPLEPDAFVIVTTVSPIPLMNRSGQIAESTVTFLSAGRLMRLRWMNGGRRSLARMRLRDQNSLITVN